MIARIVFCSRAIATTNGAFKNPQTIALLSITSPHHLTLPVFENQDLLGALKRMIFSDTRPDKIDPDSPKKRILFTKEMALSIWEWVARFDGIETIVVHCSAGKSRSPAIVIALIEVIVQNGAEIAKRVIENEGAEHNIYVLKLMREAFAEIERQDPDKANRIRALGR